jgi:hypothetical protein
MPQVSCCLPATQTGNLVASSGLRPDNEAPEGCFLECFSVGYSAVWLGFLKAQLDSRIAVPFHRLDLGHKTGASFMTVTGMT